MKGFQGIAPLIITEDIVEEVSFTLDEYKRLIFYMMFPVGQIKLKKGRRIAPLYRVKAPGDFLKKYECTGFFDYRQVEDDLYEFTLTIKGIEYLSNILGIEIK